MRTLLRIPFRHAWLALAFLLQGLPACQLEHVQAQEHVTLEHTGGRFRLLRNGRPYTIKGVGGKTRLAELAAAGGNSCRTWNAKDLGTLLERAEAHGLTVCAGLWLGHPRHGFDYQDRTAVRAQLEEKLNIVRQYRKHAALLLWAIGNEMEGEGEDIAVWKAVNEVAREVKRLDPHHPTMTVIAEVGERASKLRHIERHCDAIDIIGINSYGGAETLGTRIREAGIRRPYIVTEHGPLGPWEVHRTKAGSPLEPTSTQKAKRYARGYRANAVETADLCLGTYAFLWGHKQETTATWFGMWLKDGSKLAAVDELSHAWTGSPPGNRCPQIHELHVDRTRDLKPGDVVNARVTARDPEQDALTFRWVLRSDSRTIGAGGDPQETETPFPQAVTANRNQARVVLPEGGGGYRLFVYVHDDHGGAAVANVPLFLPAPIKLAKVMPPRTLPHVVYGEGAPESPFLPTGFMGNAAAVRMSLESRQKPRSGKTCIQAQYLATSSWGGVLWQSPAGDWEGEQPGGANLTGATHLEFWVRGHAGGEVVTFSFGALNGNQPYRDTAEGKLERVRLKTSWQRLRIPLEGLDLRQIKTGFAWSAAGQGSPLTFYLDDIRYVRQGVGK